MPVSPALAEHLAADLVDAYAEAERRLLALLAKRLAAGVDSPRWAQSKLAQVQAYKRETQALLRDLEAQARTGVETALTQAYEAGGLAAFADIAKLEPMDESLVALDERIATVEANRRSRMKLGLRTKSEDAALVRLAEQRADIMSVVGRASSVEPLAGLRALNNLNTETLGNVTATHRGILRTTQDAYRSIVADAEKQVLVGSQTRRQAAQQALDRFAKAGIKGFVGADGRGWTMESYTEMAMRTGCGRACVAGHEERLIANDFDLVIISDAPRECPTCRPHEGQVYSLSGASKRYPSIDSARDAGLFHCSCRHMESAYQEGVTKMLHGTADPEGYAATTKLRYLERQTRAAKRVEAAAMDGQAKRAATAKVRECQAKIRAHVASTPAKRQPHRETLGAL